MNFINTGLDDEILKSMDAEHPSDELVKAMNKHFENGGNFNEK